MSLVPRGCLRSMKLKRFVSTYHGERMSFAQWMSKLHSAKMSIQKSSWHVWFELFIQKLNKTRSRVRLNKKKIEYDDHFIRSFLSTLSFMRNDVTRGKPFCINLFKVDEKATKWEKLKGTTETWKRARKSNDIFLGRETSRYGCLYGGKWQDVNANGRIPARFLINFFAIITTAHWCKCLRLISREKLTNSTRLGSKPAFLISRNLFTFKKLYVSYELHPSTKDIN